MHGYLPDHPAMRSLFVAAGPGVARRAEPLPVDSLDVAPTAAALLGLTFSSPIDGRVRTEVLRGVED